MFTTHFEQKCKNIKCFSLTYQCFLAQQNIYGEENQRAALRFTFIPVKEVSACPNTFKKQESLPELKTCHSAFHELGSTAN